jgi:4-amino-4-deoxy-L-arabinose transferase-like glycosyltransferase
MVRLLTTRGTLVFGIILFIALKISALHYPFYWDESWSYAPGVKLMYLHGPSLMPNAIDQFYSRGHPLLFYASAAAWMKIFGASHFSQHSFALFISVLLIIAMYEVCIRLFNKRVAVISLFLLPLQVIFYVQATFLLPEMMIALLSLLSLYFYVKGRHKLTILSLTALLFTKESGMVLALVLGIHAFFYLFNKEERRRARAKKFLSVALPCMLIGIFFLLQKRLNGWYLYPEHTGYIQLVRHVFWYKFMYALDTLFAHDNRIRLFQLLLLLCVIVAVHLREIRYAAPLLTAYLIFITVDNRFHWVPRKALFLLLMGSFFYAIRQLIHLSDTRTKQKTQFIYLGTSFLFSYLVFSCINFFSARYLLCAMAILFILVAAYFDFLISRLYDQIYKLTIACIMLIAYYAFKYNDGLLDKNLGAFDAMKVQEEVVTYFEKSGLYDKSIATDNFLNVEHLQKPFTGFLHSDHTFSSVTYNISSATDYVILDNIKLDAKGQNLMYDTVSSSPSFQLVYKSAKGPAWAEVYKRNR